MIERGTNTSFKKRRSLYFAGVVFLASCAAALAIACSAESEASDFGAGGDGGPSSANDGGSFPIGDSGVGPPIRANAVVIVHAARLPAFRLCFVANAANSLPTPSAVLMPDSNIVGVEVGSAVRVPPIANAVGDVYAIPEEKIRTLYPPGTTVGPKCDSILSQYQAETIKLGAITQDLSSGVNLLVVGGCLPSAKDPSASVARCGSDWTAATGNASITTIPVTAYARQRPDFLPLQVMQLSPALAARANGRNVTLSFGTLDDGGVGAPVISEPLPIGVIAPQSPTVIQYAPTETPSYRTTGFAISVGGSDTRDGGAADGGDGGPKDAGLNATTGELVFKQSLAEIGQLSSSRVVPSEWFSIPSSFIFLVVGDDTIPDGGSLDRFHLLAVPVARPNDEDGGEPLPSQRRD